MNWELNIEIVITILTFAISGFAFIVRQYYNLKKSLSLIGVRLENLEESDTDIEKIKPIVYDTQRRVDMLEIRIDNSINNLTGKLDEFTKSIRETIVTLDNADKEVRQDTNENTRVLAVIQNEISNIKSRRRNIKE